MDVGVAVLDTVARGLTGSTLANYQQVAVIPTGHPLGRHRSLHLADLDGSSLVVPPPDRPHRIALERALRRAHVAWTCAIEVEGWAQMMHFVSLGIGIGIAIVNGCIRPPTGLVTRPVADLPPVTYTALQRRSDADDKRVGAVIDTLKASAS